MEVQAMPCGRGRCIVATADFDDDEIVFSIPRKAVLNVQTALPNVNTSVSQAIPDMPSWLGLTTLMISESFRQDSKWAPYFSVLPQELDSLVFWSDSELAELQASTVAHKIGKVKAEEMFSQHIAPLGLTDCSTDMCHRVASIIMAYAFDIPEKISTTEGDTSLGDVEDELISDDEGDEKTLLSMIPLADMLNADAARNNARLCCDNEDLEMRTIKPIAKGEEIFNDYGQLPRSDLLRRYGYVTKNYAIYDVAEISTESMLTAFRNGTIQTPNLEHLSDQDLERRVELAEREGVYEETYDLAHPGPDGPSIPDELLAFIYLLLVDNENFESITKSQTSVPSRSKLATELVGKVLVDLLRAREEEYATTIEEDDILEAAESIPRRTKMAIQVRLGEKQVLRDAIREAGSFRGDNKRMRLPTVTKTNGTVQNGKRRGEEVSKPIKKGRFQ
ncbi:Ribosomal lysine N-methyltransferase 4 [Hyphodiscus hymeniophilus]|uniref:Ribosomal lysine N-methyltransferase 4 n=1 Tax=Hyphodiscus hymeniophilus TaxID=353542 RepID=A0A9P6VI77_9HELO|nr:Ribosomal lysine N-methyltransferase 4 [Hyphodiscus hymeniophilus]